MFKYQITVNFYSKESANEFNESLNIIGESLKIFHDVWLVKSNLKPSDIKSILSNYLSEKDYYTVLKIDNNAGFIIVLPPGILDWISS